MASTVQIRNSSTAAAEPSSLEAGELAINTADAKLFWEDSAGSIQTTYLQPNLGDLADVSDTVPSPNTSVYVLANVPGVGWSSQGTIGSVSVGSEPIGGWPSGSVGESLDGKASTSHASTHATGGSDAIAPEDIGAAPAASPTFTGDVTIPDKIIHSGDSNTAIRFPAADAFTIETNGVERLRVANTIATFTIPFAVNCSTASWAYVTSTSPTAYMKLSAASASDYWFGANGGGTEDQFAILTGAGASQKLFSVGQDGFITAEKGSGGFVAHAGTASAPSVSIFGDPDTGTWSPGANQWAASTAGVERLRIDSSGNVGIDAASPTAKLDINADTIRLRTAKTPASSSDTGNAGDICWDSSYLYICTATDTWRRIAHSTW